VQAKLTDADSGLELEKEDGPTLPMIKSSESQYAIRVITHRLSPRVRSEEFIVVDAAEQPTNGDDVLIGTDAGEVIAATFLYERGNAIFVASFDTGVPTPILKDKVLTLVPVVSIFTKHVS
jgi:SOS-response transcriptional repressor LexA